MTHHAFHYSLLAEKGLLQSRQRISCVMLVIHMLLDEILGREHLCACRARPEITLERINVNGHCRRRRLGWVRDDNILPSPGWVDRRGAIFCRGRRTGTNICRGTRAEISLFFRRGLGARGRNLDFSSWPLFRLHIWRRRLWDIGRAHSGRDNRILLGSPLTPIILGALVIHFPITGASNRHHTLSTTGNGLGTRGRRDIVDRAVKTLLLMPGM